MTAPRRLRVLDLTDHAAAYATRLLVDLGVQVIRLEAPGRTHETRSDARDRCFNAGKRSAGIDLRGHDGLEVLARLCATADAVVEGIEPVFAYTNQAYARCAVANPRLTWVAIRPLVPETVAVGTKSAEIVRYAQSGLMSITGVPGKAPALVGGGLADSVTATFGALACMLGCRMAERTRLGHLITVSAHEVLSMVMQQGLYEAAFSNRITRRGGNRHAHIAAAGALPCRDGYVVVSANERRMWQALVEMVGDDRLRDPALSDERIRLQRQAEIFEILEAWARGFSKAELSDMAQARGIPVAPVCDIRDLLHDPQLRARGFFQQVDGDEIPALLTPWHGPLSAAPRPGEHTAAILTDAGFSREEIARLQASGVVPAGAVPIQQGGARA